MNGKDKKKPNLFKNTQQPIFKYQLWLQVLALVVTMTYAQSQTFQDTSSNIFIHCEGSCNSTGVEQQLLFLLQVFSLTKKLRRTKLLNIYTMHNLCHLNLCGASCCYWLNKY